METSLATTAAPSRSSDDRLDVAAADTRSRATTLRMNYSFGDMNVGEAEQRLLGGGSGRGPYYRFLTLHRRRRRKLPTRRLDKQHQALLDDLYNGITQVCWRSPFTVWFRSVTRCLGPWSTTQVTSEGHRLP